MNISLEKKKKKNKKKHDQYLTYIYINLYLETLNFFSLISLVIITHFNYSFFDMQPVIFILTYNNINILNA